MSIVHARNTVDGLRFLLWRTVTYDTSSLSRDEMVERMLVEVYGEPDDPFDRDRAIRSARSIAERLGCAAATGTSLLMRSNDPPSLDAPWDGERCRFCDRFHHAFEAASPARCCACGGLPACSAHAPPCAP